MSALNIIRLKHFAIMLTDAAVYDVNSGAITAFGIKQFAVPSWPGVIATRGAALATPLLGHFLSSKFQTFDALVAGIEDAIRDVFAEVKRLVPGHPDDPIDFVGWSTTRGRFESYTISISDKNSAVTREDETPEGKARAIQSEPFKLFPLRSIAYGPLISQEAFEKTRLLDAARLSAAELYCALIALLCEQRKNLYKCKAGDFSGVGGFGLISVVDQNRIRQGILCRWPQDRVGERIVVDGISKPPPEDVKVKKRTGNGKDAPAPIIVGIGGSQTHQGDLADLGPYAPTTGTAGGEEIPSGMDVPFDVFQNAVRAGEPQGPEFAGYEPFAMEGYPNTYASPIGPEYAGYEPFATEGNYPFANEPFATGDNVAYPGEGFPVEPVERGEELFPPMEMAQREDVTGFPNPVGPVEYGGPLGRVTQEPGTVLGGEPVEPGLPGGAPIEVGHAGELYPPMEYTAPPQPTGMIGPDRPPTEPQGPELPSYEQMLAGINIPPQIAPAQEVERAPLDDIPREAFDEEAARQAEEAARQAQEEEFVSPEMERDAIAMERYSAPVGPLSPPQARDAVTFDRNARAALGNVSSDIQNKIAPYLEQMSPREKVDLITGRTTVLDVFAQKSGYSVNDVRGYLDKNYPGGAAQLQADLQRPGERAGPIALESQALQPPVQGYAGIESWGVQPLPEAPPVAGPEQGLPSGMDIAGNQGLAALGGAWAAPPMMSPQGTFPIAPPENTGDYPPMTIYSGGFPPSGGPVFPPGIHEIPGVSPPFTEPPAVPGPGPDTPSPGAPYQQQPSSPDGLPPPPYGGYVGGGPYGVSAADISYASSVAEAYPAEVQAIAMKYRVPILTAALMFMQMMQQGAPAMAEGGRIPRAQIEAETDAYMHAGNWPREIAEAVRANPKAWDAWVRGLPESENVEDRRNELSDEDVLKAYGYRKSWK